MPRFAVIDLGTNTFHMLIVEKGENGMPFKEIHRERRFVKLAQEGIETIGKVPFERGIKVLEEYRQIVTQYEVDDLRAYGTAALRTASNGAEFVKQAKEIAQISIKLITGDIEAQLIRRGVLMTLPKVTDPYFIMDIGGGSVEFIIGDQKKVLWAQSFPIGVAVLYKNFHHNEPITKTEIEELEAFLEKNLSSFFTALKTYPTQHLVGASGTFDVIGKNLAGMKPADLMATVPTQDFFPFFQKVLHTTSQQRYKMPEVPDERADLIVVALILVNFILKNANIQQLTVSNYAMKEGILAEMLE